MRRLSVMKLLTTLHVMLTIKVFTVTGASNYFYVSYSFCIMLVIINLLFLLLKQSGG